MHGSLDLATPPVSPSAHQWKDLRVSAEARSAIRRTLKSAPGWEAFRAEYGNITLDKMSKDQLLAACQLLDIDAEEIADNADRHASVDTAEDVEIYDARVTPPPADRTPFAEATVRGAATPAPAAPAAPVTPDAQRLAAELAALLTRPQTAPLDEARVREIADESTGRAGAAVLAAVKATLDTLAQRHAEETRKLIAAAVADLPVTRIEIARAGEAAREVAGHKHPAFITLARAAAARMGNGYAPNIWLAGPAGSGKTHAAHQLADALGRPFLHNGALSMAHELLGFIDAGGTYHRTAFRDAYEHGGVYLFDEVDGSDNSALLALNAALANGHAQFPDGPVKRHADCLIIATANTWGNGATAEYVGRAKIDAAFLSRFPVRIAWDYDAKLEIALAGQFPAWAKRVQRARAKARDGGVKVLIDPRATQAGAALLAAGMDEDEVASLTYLANLTPDQRRLIG